MKSFQYNSRFLNSRWILPKQLTHIAIFGTTRQGKSTTLKACAERAYLRGVKIVDLFAAGEFEGAYWSLESNHEFWKTRKFKFRNQILKKQSFPVRCLLPICKDFPNEVPDFFKPFSISIKDLTEEGDLKAMLGNTLTKNEISLWRSVSENITRKTTLLDLLNFILDAQKSHKIDDIRIPGIHGAGITSLYNMLSTFKKHYLFTSDDNPLSLNLKAELKDRKTITSLILTYFPREIRPFIVNHFIYKIYDMFERNEIKHPVIILIREAGDFLVNLSTESPQEQAVKYNITQSVRKGAKHRLYFWLDNQSPMNIDIIKDQFEIKISHKVDNILALQSALGDLGTMLLDRSDYMRLQNFTPGRCFVVEPRGLFNPQIFPPLSRFSAIDGTNFIDVWRAEKGESRFIKTKPLLIPAYDEYDTSEKKWKDEMIERNTKKQLIKERDSILKANKPIISTKSAYSKSSNISKFDDEILANLEI